MFSFISSFFNTDTITAAGDTTDERNGLKCENKGLQVALLATEAFKDVNDEEFTMYYLQVTSKVDGKEWQLYRRYSQFFELKNRLELVEGYGTITKGVPFPGKVYFNKTAPAVVEERKIALLKWMNTLLESDIGTHYQINSFLESIGDEALTTGNKLPQMAEDWKDIYDKSFNFNSFPENEIVVISAASYWTFQALTMVLDRISKATADKYDLLHFTQIAISELRLVPKNVRSHVHPFLQKIVNNSKTKLRPNSQLLFVPDYEGSCIKALGVRDCDWTWRVWIVFRGVVRLEMRSSCKDPEGTYDDCVSSIFKDIQVEQQ